MQWPSQRKLSQPAHPSKVERPSEIDSQWNLYGLSGIWRLMMSAEECRARARAARATARGAPDAKTRLYWEDAASDWSALAIQAAVQEAMQRRLRRAPALMIS